VPDYESCAITTWMHLAQSEVPPAIGASAVESRQVQGLGKNASNNGAGGVTVSKCTHHVP
jgi:hypothetical protein